jgi:hypothetical protein
MRTTIHLNSFICDFPLHTSVTHTLRSTQQDFSKVKQSHYRPRKALRAPGCRSSQVFRQSAHEGGKVVSPTHRPPLPPQERFPVLISVRGWVYPRAIVRPKRLCQWKIPMTPSGIETALFRHRVPQQDFSTVENKILERIWEQSAEANVGEKYIIRSFIMWFLAVTLLKD